MRSKEEKEAAKVDHQADQQKKSEWKRLIGSKSEKRKSRPVDPIDQIAATPVLPEENVGQSLERAPTGSSSIANVDVLVQRNATNSSGITNSTTHDSDAIGRDGDKFDKQEPKSPQKKRFSGILSKLHRKSKSTSKEDAATTEKGFEGGAAYTGAFAAGIPQEHNPAVMRTPSVSSLSSEEGEGNVVHTGSPEQERGRTKNRVVESSDEEFEEARDTFDDSALAPPPKLLSSKTGSPVRETKFSEAL